VPPGRWLRVHDREALAPALVPAPSPLFAFAAVRGNERAKSSRDSLALFRNLWHRLEFPSYFTGTGDSHEIHIDYRRPCGPFYACVG